MSDELTTSKEINAAIQASVMGSGRNVYADIKLMRIRVIKARMVKGVLEVKSLASGTWHPAIRVYQA